MEIFDLFSKRKSRAAAKGPAPLIYDALPEPFRVQVIYIWQSAIGPPSPPQTALHYLRRGRSLHAEKRVGDDLWPAIHDFVAKELGRFELAQGTTKFDACCAFLMNPDTVDHALDLIEVSFVAIDNAVRNRYAQSVGQAPAAAIEELNARFAEHHLGYRFVSGRIVRVDSEYLHAEVVEPALSLLADARFAGAEEEFLDALKYLRQRDPKGAITCALKALESTIKVICDERGWVYPTNATAFPLLEIVFKNGLLPQELETHFAGLRAVLSSGVPTIRNATKAAHGQGAVPIDVPEHLAAYTIHTAAADILLLVRAFIATTK